ncbi:MAG: DegT/DnrJ/EryC1/StrS family aminotransferase [Sulfuriferula sp.]
MINVTKTYLPPLEEYTDQLQKIWDSGLITNNGATEQALETALLTYLQIQHLQLVSNGTLALQLAIKALDLHGEIITTPYSYVATTNAILWEGCEPVFVDIEAKTFCINPDLIEAAITNKTTAIIATHVYGYPCDTAKIQEIADKYNLKVIYDAAHAFAVDLNEQSLLSHGDATILSFHATKLFHTAEGGAVVCKDPRIAERIYQLKMFGHLGEDKYFDIGINAKMSELHAAMGLCVLPKVAEQIKLRKACVNHYDEMLSQCGLQRPAPQADFTYNYAYYPVVFETHQAMMSARQALMSQDINPRRYFYPSLNTLPFLKPELKRACPVSEDIATRVLCLPLHAALSVEEISMISDIIVRTLHH